MIRDNRTDDVFDDAELEITCLSVDDLPQTRFVYDDSDIAAVDAEALSYNRARWFDPTGRN
jgi:hypothetical protein